jgi:Rad3-related DNA helicase
VVKIARPSDLGLPDNFKDWRPGQLETIEAIAESNKNFYLLDAPTGSGKSIIGVGCWKRMADQYDVLDRMSDDEDAPRRQCVYITRTIQLQNQLIQEFPGMAKTMKGRSNYHCLLTPDKTSQAVMKVITGDGTANKETLTADQCRGSKNCPSSEECPYLVAKKAAIRSPLVVLNTAYFLAEANGPGQFSKARWLIVDEVDSLESELMNFVHLSVSGKQCVQYGIQSPEYCSNIHEWKSWADINIVKLRLTWNEMEKDLSLKDPNTWTNIEIKMQKQLTQLGNFIEKLQQFTQIVDDDWIIRKEDEKTTESYLRSRSTTRWTLKPVSVARYAYQYLWRHCQRTIGMSGTILDPAILAHDLGIEDYEYKRLDSPFPIENRPIYYEPVGRLNHANMEVTLPLLARKVQTIMETYPEDRILVHTTSYRVRDFLYANLPRARLMTHNSEDREDALEIFKNGNLPKVMLSPSFDRGVDLPAARFAKQVVIVCKIPYPDLSDPQVKARLEMPGGEKWYVIRTAQTLLQMTGRMTRNKNDFTDIYILDGSFMTLLQKTRGSLYKWWTDAIRWAGHPKKL